MNENLADESFRELWCLKLVRQSHKWTFNVMVVEQIFLIALNDLIRVLNLVPDIELLLLQTELRSAQLRLNNIS